MLTAAALIAGNMNRIGQQPVDIPLPNAPPEDDEGNVDDEVPGEGDEGGSQTDSNGSGAGHAPRGDAAMGERIRKLEDAIANMAELISSHWGGAAAVGEQNNAPGNEGGKGKKGGGKGNGGTTGK